MARQHVKTDNTSALHYINVGRGRFKELSDLARSIRMLEISLGIESVGVHIPGVNNVTLDALSRFYLHNDFRDRQPHKTLRKRLFQSIVRKVGQFTIDGMVAEDGHNRIVDTYCTPSDPFFEIPLAGQRAWLFPPLELVGSTLKFVLNQSKSFKDFGCCILVPLRTSVYWAKYLPQFRRVEQFASGSDLFRLQVDGHFVRAPKIAEPWVVITLNM